MVGVFHLCRDDGKTAFPSRMLSGFASGGRGNRDAKESVCVVGIDPYGVGRENAGKYLWNGRYNARPALSSLADELAHRYTREL